jgi:very-short-patch-repair endonuclease
MIGKIDRARRLRRDQTDAERVLWLRLRDRRLGGLKFKRQVPIDRYVVDFLCAEARLVVELDGGQHATRDESNRTKILEAMGYLVVRFWNNDVLENTDGVLEEILNILDRAPEPPHPDPLPTRTRVFPGSGIYKIAQSRKHPTLCGEREQKSACGNVKA